MLPFKNKEDIENYFKGDKIQCLICEKYFKALGTHLYKTHHINVDQYKKKFGLPWSRGLCGCVTADKFRDNAETLRVEGKLLTGIISEEHSKKVHKKGHRRVTPSHSKFLSHKMEKLGYKHAHKHLDLEVCNKLTAKGLTQKEIGIHFGVSQMAISRFMRGVNKYQK